MVLPHARGGTMTPRMCLAGSVLIAGSVSLFSGLGNALPLDVSLPSLNAKASLVHTVRCCRSYYAYPGYYGYGYRAYVYVTPYGEILPIPDGYSRLRYRRAYFR